LLQQKGKTIKKKKEEVVAKLKREGTEAVVETTKKILIKLKPQNQARKYPHTKCCNHDLC